MEDCRIINYSTLYEQFKRHKQYLVNVSASTLEGYGWAWKAFGPVFEKTSLINKNDVIERLAILRAGGMTPVTINTYLRSLNTFFHWLHSEGHVETMLKISRLKEEQKVMQTFSDAHIVRMLAFKPKNKAEVRMCVIIRLILDNGARIDEVLSIERPDVDLDNLLITIRKAKGRKERVVPISIQLMKALYRHVESHRPKAGDLLFFTGAGVKLSQRNALRVFKAICKKVGITGPRCSFHTLRHTFGKAYIGNGGDVFRLQKMLGHAKLEMTRRYVNLETADLQKVHQQFSVLAQSSR